MKPPQKKRKTSGQTLLEFNLVTLLMIAPLGLSALIWGQREWSRCTCANYAFKSARERLIQTQAPIRVQPQCGAIQESVTLLPLRNLATGGPIQSALTGLVQKASQHLEQASHSVQSLPPGDSSN